MALLLSGNQVYDSSGCAFSRINSPLHLEPKITLMGKSMRLAKSTEGEALNMIVLMEFMTLIRFFGYGSPENLKSSSCRNIRVFEDVDVKDAYCMLNVQ